jgi:hypothetical protein
MSGTNYTLIAGFWAVAIQAPAAPLLQITNSAGSAMFFWDKSYGDFVLEQTTVLWPPNHIVWSPVAQAFQTNSTSIYVTVPATGSGQFFRLRKQ